MGNSQSEPPNFDNVAYIRLLLLGKCAKEYDKFNVCIDDILPKTPEYTLNDPNHRYNIAKIPDEKLRNEVARNCNKFIKPMLDCVTDKKNIGEVVDHAFDTILKSEPSSHYQVKCRYEYTQAVKCQVEAKNNNYVMEEYCKDEMSAVTECAAKILAAEKKSEYRTASREFTLYQEESKPQNQNKK